MFRFLFSDSPRERFPSREPVQTAESARPQQLLSAGERSVIVEIILRGFVFNLLRSQCGIDGCCLGKSLKNKNEKKNVSDPHYTFWTYDNVTDCDVDLMCVQANIRKVQFCCQRLIEWMLIVSVGTSSFEKYYRLSVASVFII